MRTWWRRWGERLVLRWGTLVEAFVALILARVCIVFCFAWTARWALRRPDAVEAPHPHLEQRIRWAVATAGRWLPGDKVCLPNAIAAKAMLARRGVKSTIHLGVGKHPNGALHAHAWLEVGGGAILTGAGEHARVAPIVR